MRIVPISVITTYTQKKQTTFNKPQSNMSTTFKAVSRYEQEIEARTEEIIKEKNMSGWKLFWGGEAEAKRQAIIDIDKKNHKNEIESIKNKAINEVLNERIKDNNEYMEKIELQQRRNDELMNEFKEAHSQTILIQKEALAAQKVATDSLRAQIENYQKIVKEQQEIQTKRTREINELVAKISEAREKQDTKIVEMFEKELKSLKDFYNAQLNSKIAEAEKIRNVETLFQKMNQVQSNKGFGRIAGYQDVKDLLISIIGNSIILEKDGQNIVVPNGILFFGPKGNGKTTFAQAFAEQLDCNIVKIENTLDPVENLKTIRKEAEKGKKLFEEKGVRTILQIDEFDEFAPKEDKIVGPLKTIFDNISNDYHCTFFLTTNYPEKIDTILMRDGRLDVKVPLKPADKNNIMEILDFYGKPFADETVNFEALADIVLSYLPEASYSNARLKSVVKNFIKEHNVTKMSQEDFITSLKNIRPDITKEALMTFNKQVELMKHV